MVQVYPLRGAWFAIIYKPVCEVALNHLLEFKIMMFGSVNNHSNIHW